VSHLVEPLADGHDLDAFTCGHPDLDQWSVDAVDEIAASFYRAHDFQRMGAGPHPLVMKINTVARGLELPWP
jgi:hypothetical protein